MKDNVKDWAILWVRILALILGVPTIGLAWCLWYSAETIDNYGERWQLKVVDGVEIWFTVIRVIILLLTAIPSLFFTLYILVNLKRTKLEQLRAKYKER